MKLVAQLVGQPIMAAAGFQRHDATGSRWIEPLTTPGDRVVENKSFIGAVTGESRPWSFYISRGFAPIVGQALSPANHRALDQCQARGFAARPALTGLYST